MKFNNKIFDTIKLDSKKNVAIVGSSICSCLIGKYIKSKYKAKVVFYEKTKFIGGAWRADKYGNIFSNIIAPTNTVQKKIFNRVLSVLKKNKIKIKKTNSSSFYANQIVETYNFDFNYFYKNIIKNFIFRKHEVNSICENNDTVLINNRFRHDYVLFPNSVHLKRVYKNSPPSLEFKFPRGKIIKSKHIRIFFKDKIENKLKSLYYSDKKFGPIDRVQVIKIRDRLSKLSGRISIEYKTKPKYFIIRNLKKLFGIKNIIKASIYSYKNISYKPNKVQLIKQINNKFSRVKHFDTSSVVTFISKYLF